MNPGPCLRHHSEGAGQAFENGEMTMLTRVVKSAASDYMDIQNAGNETGGEVLADDLRNLRRLSNADRSPAQPI